MAATMLSRHSGPYDRRLGTKIILLFIILLQSVILTQQCEKSLTQQCAQYQLSMSVPIQSCWAASVFPLRFYSDL